jgi:hypothetical protein
MLKAAGELTSEELFSWVHAGLLRFQQQSLTAHTTDIDLHQGRISMVLSSFTGMEWNEINQLLGERLAEESSGPGVLVDNDETDLAELFLFTLCSAIELDRAISQRVATLQNSGYPSWLQVGFAAEILAFLFVMERLPDLSQFRLVNEELLIIKGQGPHVSRDIFTSADYWKAIQDRLVLSEFTAIRDDGIRLDEALIVPNTEFLQRNSLLATETDHKTAEALTLAIAQSMELVPIRMEERDWKQKSLRALCRYAGWLPLVGCEKSESTIIDDVEDFTPAIFSVRSDQLLPDNCLRVDFPRAPTNARKLWWQEWIDNEQALIALAACSLNQASVRRIGKQLLRPKDDDVLRQVKAIRSAEGTAHLKRVASPVDTWVTQQMMIFPPDTHQALEQCFTRSLERDYSRLGMGDSIRATANPGIVFLFSGASGVGKTLASSWLASRLGAPLFKIDLALILNKYVGETEKNISVALDEAAKSDVILLFDEADALFGKRTDGSHSGDRYSNMLTNYLLSRIETHPGIVILTTNAGSRMDPAFQRRIDIDIEFQALAYEERIRLWEAMLASRNPGKTLCQRVARYCELPPGHVRNVVINACCWHPQEVPLSAHAIWLGLEEEYRKIGHRMPSQLMALKDNNLPISPQASGDDG